MRAGCRGRYGAVGHITPLSGRATIELGGSNRCARSWEDRISTRGASLQSECVRAWDGLFSQAARAWHWEA